jgi:hypothetical protein
MHASAADALHEGAELALEAVEGGIKEFPAWNNDDIQTCGGFLVLKQLAHPALGAVSHDGAANLARRRDSEPGHWFGRDPGKDRHKTPVCSNAGLISLLKVYPAPNMLGRPEGHQRSSETVRRLRPLARRRFNTCCPSLVAMRTKKPCVFFRRRVFG